LEHDSSIVSKHHSQEAMKQRYRLCLLKCLDDLYEDSLDPSYLLLRAYGAYYVKQDFINALHILSRLKEVVHWYSLQDRIFMSRLRSEIESELAYRW